LTDSAFLTLIEAAGVSWSAMAIELSAVGFVGKNGTPTVRRLNVDAHTLSDHRDANPTHDSGRVPR
jgi:hypothetical protein